MLRAFLFDMDGTLIDTEVLWVEATETYLRTEGYAPRHEEVLADVYGVAGHELRENIQRRYPNLVGDEDALYQIFLELRAQRDLMIPGSVQLLRDLARDYPVALVSGSGRDDVAAGVAHMGISDCLAFTLDESCYHPGKPDPVCFRMAAERLEVPPESCLVFEDSQVGVAAAKRAGMHCVALARPDRPPQDLSQADVVLENLGDFDVADYVSQI
jgi:HAD superfamily hydrolase (TIGR01509 family)